MNQRFIVVVFILVFFLKIDVYAGTHAYSYENNYCKICQDYIPVDSESHTIYVSKEILLKSNKNSTFCMPNSVTDISELAFNKNIRRILISDNLVIRSENSKGAQYIYLNDGNSLSVGCYLYCPVENI